MDSSVDHSHIPGHQSHSLSSPHFAGSHESHGDGHHKGLVTEVHQHKPHHVSVEGDIKILKTVELNSEGMCCKFSEDGEKMALGLSNGDIKVYKAATGSCIYHLSDEDTKSDRLPVTSLNFVPKDLSSRGELLIATYASGVIKFWHIETATSLQTIHESCQLLAASLSPSSLHLVVGGSSEQIYLYDVATGKKAGICAPSPNKLVMDGHRFRIFALKHYPIDDCTFLSGGWDDTIQIWDQREEHSVRRIFGPHICGDGLDVDVKHGHILSASWRKHDVLQVWDFKTGNRIKTIPPDFSGDSLLYCGQWLGKDHILCGGSEQNIVRVIDKTTLATSGIISHLPSGVYSVDHDRNRLSRHHHHHGDVTMITATAGNHLYFLSNAPVVPKHEK
ncbi:WD repeat-containing protein 18-like [Clavelina lepadiformis]|uniref:Uncharacterized protein n=1 Tax=Clavelina lepadiformis TaxID=159417 RepID=A0ABP0GKP5_CLALP